MTVTEDIRYIGVNDHDIDLFEAQYTVPEGMSYNSYVILDEKVAVMDTVDGRFGGEWIGNLEKELSGRTPDYLVVQHMEPDHSANIAVFAEKYPSAKIVASKQAFVMMKQFFGTDYADRQVVAAEKDTLELGKHTLNFIAAPMVHWPEVMVTYDSTDRYPRDVLRGPTDKRRINLHPTQKPVWLCEQMILTYTNEGQTVLDCCMGSGSIGVACKQTGRNYIGIDNDPHWVNVATQRIGQISQ